MPGRPSPSIQRTQGGVTVGVNLGIAEVGISTDYGGAGKIGFGGQSVTWGLEGGKIQMGIAGFELIVEARNCVVTEIKKIAGQVVSTRTYPDPGCEKEEEEEQTPKQPEINPNNLKPLIPVGMDEQKFAYVFLNVYLKFLSVFGALPIEGVMTNVNYSAGTAKTSIKKGALPSIVPSYTGGFFPSFASSLAESEDEGEIAYYHTWRNYGGVSVSLGDFVQNYRPALASRKVRKKISSYSYSNVFRPGFPSITVQSLNNSVEILQASSTNGGGIWPPNSNNLVVDTAYAPLVNSMVAWGRLDAIKDWITEFNSRPISTNNGLGYRYEQIIVSEIIYPGNQQKPPQGGNRPPMNQNCCKEILADLADLKDVLAVKEMKTKKVSIPGELIKTVTEGESEPPDEVISNYAQMGNAMLLAVNKYGIHTPLTAEIEDANLIQKGKQPDSITYNSPGMAIKAILDDLLEIKAQNNARLEIQVRLAYTCTRILKIVAGIGESLAGIIKVFGFPFRRNKPKSLPLDFNLAAAKKGGYGKQVKGKEKTPSPEELGQMLSALLESTTYELPAPSFDPDDDDVRELLVKILLSVQK